MRREALIAIVAGYVGSGPTADVLQGTLKLKRTRHGGRSCGGYPLPSVHKRITTLYVGASIVGVDSKKGRGSGRRIFGTRICCSVKRFKARRDIEILWPRSLGGSMRSQLIVALMFAAAISGTAHAQSDPVGVCKDSRGCTDSGGGNSTDSYPTIFGTRPLIDHLTDLFGGPEKREDAHPSPQDQPSAAASRGAGRQQPRH